MPAPDGWRDCPDMASDLIEGIFFAFKTPLNGAAGIFTVDSIFNHAKNKKWTIGLWIDLTNSTKARYNSSLVERQGAKYHKFPSPGQKTPPPKSVAEFNSICKKFLKENPSKIIGIHCTHGFNRTGYFICSYLSDVKKMDAHTALKTFAGQRPPGIYRQKMVNEFVEFFGGWRGPPPPKVFLPPWEKRGDKGSKDSNNNAHRGTDSANASLNQL